MSEDLCDVCRPERREYDGPGVPIRSPGVLHRSGCPTLPHPTPEAVEELQQKLDDLRRARARAMAEAHNIWIA